MLELARIAEWEAYAILFAVVGIVVLRLWTGDIRTRGLVEGRMRNGSPYLSASRVQLLIATLAAAAQYINQVRQSPHGLPDVPRAWLIMLGASHVVYLGNKFQGKRNDSFHI